jgi:hypothetical protein
MKAEIGFARDADHRVTDRLRLVITPESATEGTSLAMYAKRMGLAYNEFDYALAIDEPEAKGA